jgi:hypothetical protein
VDILFFYVRNVATMGRNSFSHTWTFFPISGYFFLLVDIFPSLPSFQQLFLSLLPGHNNSGPDLDDGMSTTACTV